MKLKYVFILILSLYLLSLVITYSYTKNQLNIQETQIETLEQDLKTNNNKLDSIKLLINDYEKLDSLLAIAINKEDKLVSEEIKIKDHLLSNKYLRLKKHEKKDENTNTSPISHKTTINNIKNDSLIKKNSEEKNVSTKKETTNLNNKKIKKVYPYNGKNRLVSKSDSFIKVEYNPNNDKLINSMTDTPSRVKINDKYAKLISSTEYYTEENVAYYVLMIGPIGKILKPGTNKITVIDNISREHINYFQVTN
ncbi:hypothetical protein EV196_102244 [Mariniflexile fucanivorans]|uniref:Uncharacterized protein n=1 Tax=Mariniflexile fucanivorans TaxID=264023 RepID=A0A4R1RN96_9FLAO|nr:hypothetical protein [Mariniflexile fucanivorans]TCL67684.1 hypothetical protein EV196_102244 [Mariniflexile fucanivorans]